MLHKLRANAKFSLRRLLVVMAVFGLVFAGIGCWYRNYYRPRAMDARWESNGAIIIRESGKEGYPTTTLIANEGFGVFDVTSLRDLANLSNLIILVLSNTSVGNGDMPKIASVDSLRTVALDGTAVDDEGIKVLAALPRLKTLSIGNTEVSDDSIDIISKMSALREVDIKGTAITAVGIQRLRELRPDIRIYGDASTPQGDEG